MQTFKNCIGASNESLKNVRVNNAEKSALAQSKIMIEKLKIDYAKLQNEIENKLETCLPKYSTFARFVAMIRDQERMRTYTHFAKVRSVRPLTKLKNYILIVAQTEEDFEKKNSYIKNVLHNCFIKEI